jgi:hypothetical protein
MSKKRLKQGKYNHRINAGQMSKKRRRAVADLKTQSDYVQTRMVFTETECDMCGKEGAYKRADGKYRCTMCETVWNS